MLCYLANVEISTERMLLQRRVVSGALSRCAWLVARRRRVPHFDELRMAILKKQKNGNRMCIWNTSFKYHITDSRGKLYTMHVIRLMPRYKMRYCKYANVNG